MNVEDALVERLLKVFSLKTLEEIDTIVAKHNEKPELRYGQKELASWVVEVLFGKEAVLQAEKISDIFFGEVQRLELVKSLSPEDIKALEKEVGGCEIAGDGLKILDICVQAGLASSNGEAKKLIQSNSLYCNEEKISDPQKTFSKADLINGILLLRKGKKTFKVVKVW
jgi:tyrosyl-tRNA synthetase